MRYSDIDPMDIDPETNRPYANYSSPSLDTSFHDAEMAIDRRVEPRILEAAHHRLIERIGPAGDIAVRSDPTAKAIFDVAVRVLAEEMRHG